MSREKISTLLLAIGMVAVVGLEIPALAQSGRPNIDIVTDQMLVNWRNIQEDVAWNVSPTTVVVTVIANTPDPTNELQLWAYFNDEDVALAPPPVTCTQCRAIPSRNFEIEHNSGGWMPVTHTGPYGARGGNLLLVQESGVRGQHVVTASEEFNLNLLGVESVAAGTYHGTLFFRARYVDNHNNVLAESHADPIQLIAANETSLSINVNPAAVYWDEGHGNMLTSGDRNNAGVPALTLRVHWQVTGNISEIPVWAFFSEPETALRAIGGNATIPADSFEMRVDSGAFHPVMPSRGAVGYECVAIRVNDDNRSGTENYRLRFNINLRATELPSGLYVGRLYFQAEAVQ